VSSLRLTKFVEFLVEMYHHKTAEANPTFQLHKEDDDQWFGYFKRQYDTLWASCRNETLPRSGSTLLPVLNWT